MHSVTQPDPGNSDPLAAEARNIERLIAGGDDREALYRAKAVHHRIGSKDSERLLVRAYAARISGLAGRGLAIEARELLALAESRHPAAGAALDVARCDATFSTGGTDGLLELLADPATTPEARARMEGTLRRRVTDLDAVARSGALPAEHPVRSAAAAAARAFAAVVSGPVDDAALALPEVSSRSPFAPWKLLIRAIAAFYRGDDAACTRLLDAIPGDAAPCRLAPVLRAVMAPHGPRSPALKPAAAALAARLGVASDRLREALRGFDDAVRRKKRNAALRAIAESVAACGQAAPGLLPRLRQHLSIKCWMMGIEAADAQKAAGGPSLKDASFWRLLARANEITELPLRACGFWELFRRHAVHEGWFPEKSVESAAVCLHMADLWAKFPPGSHDEIEGIIRRDFHALDSYYDDQPPAVQALRPARRHGGEGGIRFDPGTLHRRAADCDPSPGTFERWFEWALSIHPDGKPAEAAAAAWAEALPQDTRPLLLLMDRAERRGALKKALGWLEVAERIDRLHPQVRRARLRLLAATAVRHVKVRKAHLLREDLAALRARPECQTGDAAALPAALAAALAWLEEDRDGARSAAAELRRVLEPPAAALLFLSSIVRPGAGEDWIFDLVGRDGPPAGDGELVTGVARACRLTQDLRLELSIQPAIEPALVRATSEPGFRMEPVLLLALGNAAVGSELVRLAYAVSTAGLASAREMTPRFLLLRARSLPPGAFFRRQKCIAAAVSLARIQRDEAVVREGVDLAAEDAPWGKRILAPAPASLDTSQVNDVIAKEVARVAYPAPGDDDEPAEDPPSRLARPGGTGGPGRAAPSENPLEALIDHLAPLAEAEGIDREDIAGFIEGLLESGELPFDVEAPRPRRPERRRRW